MYSVLIADDHAMIRAGLRDWLQREPTISRCAESATSAETLQQLRQASWSLLVLDINLPDRSGLDILRQIRNTHPGVKVLVMSAFAERQYAVNVLRAGAVGYFAKDQGPAQFLNAVRTILSGQHYLSDAVSDLLVSALDEPEEQAAHARLTEREFQILCKLAEGRSVSEIGAQMFISAKTVSAYRARILAKMQMTTNADLTSYAVRTGLILA
jgi:two-component system invasion response regulator UvrY